MKAAVVKGAGQPPVYENFDRPNALAGHHLIDVAASALSRITRSKAAGSHYSASGAFPFVAGVDGTGRLEDGQRVYFFAPNAPFGALAQSFAQDLAEAAEAPVVEHPGVQEVRVGDGQLERECFVEQVDDSGINRLHLRPPARVRRHAGPAHARTGDA